MTRDDMAPLDADQLPPWDCCNRRGPHAPECPFMDERFGGNDVGTPGVKARLR